MKIYIHIIIILLITPVFGQTKEEVKVITKSNNLIQLNQLKENFNQSYKENKAYAIDFAKRNNIPVKYKKNGNFFELQKIDNQGKPIYYGTFNLAAAKSTRANFLHTGGGMSLNIQGQNMAAFVWDGGVVRTTHQEYMNSGTSKIIIADGASATSDHATHVMGTINAKGHDANAKGMAPEAIGYSLDWNNDLSEVVSAIGFGMLLSNHSYGPYLNGVSPWVAGAYTNESRAWDNIMYNAPYYLQVNAGGNDGQDNSSNTNPLEGNSNYDKLIGMNTSKNTMVVANGYDAIINSTTGSILGGGTITNSSSEGPTDDYRIKPDITGNGYNVYSPTDTSDSSYGSFSGTSMASPNIMGSLLLLQQLNNDENGNYLLASSLKGLALHTTDDRGLMGPDAVYGWGYMNTKKAAEIILSNTDFISEKTLNNDSTYSFDVTSSGNAPLIVSISWIDPPGTANTGNANDTTPVLVNDLDLRITRSGTTYLPWKLTSVNSNQKMDNNVDPYERIDIQNPGPGEVYTVTINHKGSTLFNNIQNYSIIVSGISNSTVSIDPYNVTDFNIYPNPSFGNITIALNSNNEDLNLKIVNIQGKIVYENKYNNVNNFLQLDLKNIEKGIYYIIIENEYKKSTIKKLIIK